MNILLNNQRLRELNCGTNFAYILSSNSMFLPTQYKVLQSQKGGTFIPCHRILFNGQTALFYDVGEKRPFSVLLPQMTPEAFRTVTTELLQAVLQVKAVGFLQEENIDIDFSKVFVDSSTLKVSVVYVPVNERLHADGPAMENKLRAELIRLIQAISTLDSPKTTALAADLANGTLSLQDLVRNLAAAEVAPPPPRVMELRLINFPEKLSFRIDRDSFVIGRSDDADGVIKLNKYIGAYHCRIEQKDGQFLLWDLDSKNGSYVNKIKVLKKPVVLNNGDTVRLANLEFRVTL